MTGEAILQAAGSAPKSMRAAQPVMAAVFLSFLVVGMALPVLPLHVHGVLGFGPFVVGVIAGGQFIAALVSRIWAGRLTDKRGAKHAVVLGLTLGVAGGACYLASMALLHTPLLAVGLLLVGRTLLGGAESLIITGGMLWGLGVVPADRGAKVIAWVGMSMFAAMAIGAPIGSLVFERWTFLGIAVLSILSPLVGLAMIARLRPLVPKPAPTRSISSVLGAVLLPGIGFTLSGITFGAITAFLTLYFADRGWDNGALAFTAFAVSLIAMRVVLGHLPDRYGGARVAVYCLAIQALGLALIALAPGAYWAMAGSAIAGAGFSLVFPGLGIEAVRRAPSGSQGLAMGVYNAFLDLTLGIGSPALGYLAAHAGLAAVFMLSAVAALLAVPLAWALSARKQLVFRG